MDHLAPEDMTSKEYYLDSSAHFAVHEVNQRFEFVDKRILFCRFRT